MFITGKLLPKLNLPTEKGTFPTLYPKQGIPKIIHQTFYQTRLPDELQQNVCRLKELNPEWEYRFYDDGDINDFIKKSYPPNVLDCFSRIDIRYGAARADLFRYLLMYKCGGVYLDIKSSVTKPLDSVLRPDDEYLLSCWPNKIGEPYEGWGCHDELSHMPNGEFQQWYIVTAPGHPFLKAAIETVLRNIKTYNPVLHGVGKHGVLRVTGPVPYTLAINRLLSECNYRLVDSAADLGFAYSVYDQRKHVGIFKSHYTTLTFPVVRLSRRKAVEAYFAYGLKSVKRLLDSRI